MAQAVLPDDILHLLCEELANQEQFDTLFNCACTSRALAVPALTHLYKYLKPVRLSSLSTLLILIKDPIILRQSEVAGKICTACPQPLSYSLSRSGPSYGGPSLHRALASLCSHIAVISDHLISAILAIFLKMINSGQRSQSQLGPVNILHKSILTPIDNSFPAR